MYIHGRKSARDASCRGKSAAPVLRAMVILISSCRKLKATLRKLYGCSCNTMNQTHKPFYTQEQQRELKKAQKEAAKAKKKAAAGAGGDSGAPPSSTAKAMAEPVPNGAAAATAATVQFCVASPPTVAHAACSLTSTSMAFVLGEV